MNLDTNDEAFEIEVVDAEIINDVPKANKNMTVNRVASEDALEPTAFEKKMQVRPAVWDEDGNEVEFDPARHVSFLIRDSIRAELHALVGQDKGVAQAEIEKMIADKQVNSMRAVRLTETTNADPSPGRVTVIYNIDNTVNSIEVE